MRKFLILGLVILAVLCLASNGYCQANNWGNTDTNPLLKKVVPNYLQALGTGLDGSSTTIIVTVTSAIPLTYDIVKLTMGTGTYTLANGTAGQVLTLMTVGVGTQVTTIRPATSTGWVSATMDANTETLTLRYVDSTIGWIVLDYTGTTIATKASTT